MDVDEPSSRAAQQLARLCKKLAKRLMVGEKQLKGCKFEVHSQFFARNSMGSVALSQRS
jgi:hypothetical protein